MRRSFGRRMFLILYPFKFHRFLFGGAFLISDGADRIRLTNGGAGNNLVPRQGQCSPGICSPILPLDSIRLILFAWPEFIVSDTECGAIYRENKGRGCARSINSMIGEVA